MPSQFKYLPYLVPVMIIEYISSIAIVWYLYKRKLQDAEAQFLSPATKKYDLDHLTVTFQHTFSSWPGNKFLPIFLCIFRLACFGYFLGVSCIWSYVRAKGNNYYFFTTWNIELICVYYLSAFSLSLSGLLLYPGLDEYMNPRKFPVISRLTRVSHLLFEVCTSTGSLVTVVAFLFLNPKFQFWNMSVHFLTIVSLCVEMALNSFVVQPRHVCYNLSWAVMYIAFIWPMVGCRVIESWPYPFLATDTAMCFLWYSGLFAIDVAFFYFWCGVSRLKVLFLRPDLLEAFPDDSHPLSRDVKYNFDSQTSKPLLPSLQEM